VQEAVNPRADDPRSLRRNQRPLGEPMDADKMEKLIDEQARCRTRSTPPTPGSSIAGRDRDGRDAPAAGDADVTKLSGGERRRVALCKMLLATARPAAARRTDEPSRRRSVNWLERHLAEYPGTVVAVTHDRYFLDNVAQWILEIDRGRGYSRSKGTTPLARAEAGPPANRREGKRRPDRRRSRKNSNGSACLPRPGRRRARPASRPTKDVAEQISKTRRRIRIQIPPGKPLGDWSSKPRTSQVVWRQAADRQPQLPSAAGRHRRHHRPNGAGKTTLFRMIVGQEKPDSGELRDWAHGRTRLRRSKPRRARSRKDRLGGNLRRPRQRRNGQSARCNASARTSRFNFKGTDQQKLVGNSPAVNAIASTWRSCSAAAPTCCCSTNRRTISTSTRCARSKKRSLNFAGCVVVISHDRWFLDRVATHILAFEGDGYVHWCEGNFQTYEEQRKTLTEDFQR
jgi:sulfate-transporting ATPase